MVDNDSNADDFADFLYCLGSLERKKSQLFEELANKTVLNEVRGHLMKLSRGNEGQQHAEKNSVLAIC